MQAAANTTKDTFLTGVGLEHAVKNEQIRPRTLDTDSEDDDFELKPLPDEKEEEKQQLSVPLRSLMRMKSEDTTDLWTLIKRTRKKMDCERRKLDNMAEDINCLKNSFSCVNMDGDDNSSEDEKPKAIMRYGSTPALAMIPEARKPSKGSVSTASTEGSGGAISSTASLNSQAQLMDRRNSGKISKQDQLLLLQRNSSGMTRTPSTLSTTTSSRSLTLRSEGSTSLSKGPIAPIGAKPIAPKSLASIRIAEKTAVSSVGRNINGLSSSAFAHPGRRFKKNITRSSSLLH